VFILFGFSKSHFDSLTMAMVDEFVIINIEATSKADLKHDEAGDDIRFVVHVPHGTTEVEDKAFYDSETVVSAELPGTITSIGNRAFSRCSNLTTITIPPSVLSIGRFAFSSCSNLTTIIISPSVTLIGDGAFGGCSNLTTITIPPSVISIGNGAFYGCSNLTTIAIPPSVTSIGEGTFHSCPNLISVGIPDSLDNIGYTAFGSCEHLQYVAAPAHIVNNPGEIVNNCRKLEDGQKGVVLTTPATRLQVLRLQYFHPSNMSYLFRPEQRDFVTNLMMIGDRINSIPESSLPSIPNEVMVLILQQLRVHDLGPRS
jgi:hypothetical protein